MPGLVPGIHVFTASATAKTWMASELGLARVPQSLMRKSDKSDLRDIGERSDAVLRTAMPGHDGIDDSM
jgi:hypothetical protein